MRNPAFRHRESLKPYYFLVCLSLRQWAAAFFLYYKLHSDKEGIFKYAPSTGHNINFWKMYGVSAGLLNLSLCLWRADRGEKQGLGGVPFVATCLCLSMAFSVESTWIPGPPLLKLIHQLIHQSYLRAKSSSLSRCSLCRLPESSSRCTDSIKAIAFNQDLKARESANIRGKADQK